MMQLMTNIVVSYRYRQSRCRATVAASPSAAGQSVSVSTIVQAVRHPLVHAVRVAGSLAITPYNDRLRGKMTH